MKENLILKKYKKETVNGTFNLKEEETFFGTKVMEIEDSIFINDEGIQYYQYFYDVVDINDSVEVEKAKNNGYQYNEINTFLENFFLLDIVNLKLDNHTIQKQQQTEIDNEINTKWTINVDIKNILIEYLFAKIKERRTFKSIRYDNLTNKDINNSIIEYINSHLLDRFKFESLDFYVKYTDISKNSIFNNGVLKQFDPQFKSDLELSEYIDNSVNVQINNFIDPISNVTIDYFQKKSSLKFKFDYYFNITYKKI
jgi:hypothetical protein